MKHTMVWIPAFIALAILACGPFPDNASPERFSSCSEVDLWLAITDTIGVETGDSILVFGKPVTASGLRTAVPRFLTS